MAKPYSMDLRDRAMARVSSGQSVRTVAAALSVAQYDDTNETIGNGCLVFCFNVMTVGLKSTTVDL